MVVKKSVKWLLVVVIGISLIFGGIEWWNYTNYKNDWLSRATTSNEVSTLSDELTDRYATQTLNAFFDEEKDMKKYLIYLGDKWGLSDADKLKILRRAIDRIDKSISE